MIQSHFQEIEFGFLFLLQFEKILIQYFENSKMTFKYKKIKVDDWQKRKSIIYYTYTPLRYRNLSGWFALDIAVHCCAKMQFLSYKGELYKGELMNKK